MGRDKDEFAAYFEPGSPVEVARDWLEHLLARDDVPALWRITSPELRLALAQQLIIAQPWSATMSRNELDRLAGALSKAAPTEGDWPRFQRGLARILKEKHNHVDLETWGPMRPRPVGVDRELVLFVPNPSSNRVIAPGETFFAVGLLVNTTEGQVAGFGSNEPTPGWPPDFNEEPFMSY